VTESDPGDEEEEVENGSGTYWLAAKPARFILISETLTATQEASENNIFKVFGTDKQTGDNSRVDREVEVCRISENDAIFRYLEHVFNFHKVY
jgi:hypothetical protein